MTAVLGREAPAPASCGCDATISNGSDGNGDVLALDMCATAEFQKLTVAARTTINDIVGVAERAVVEPLAETGDVRRFTETRFAKFNGTAPSPSPPAKAPASRSGMPLTGRQPPHQRRLHRMAMIQLRCDPRSCQLYGNARQAGHTRREAMRILEQHDLSNIVYRTMLRDALHPDR